MTGSRGNSFNHHSENAMKLFKNAIKVAAALAFTSAAGSAMAWHNLLIKMDGRATGSIFLVGDPIEWNPRQPPPLRQGLCIRPDVAVPWGEFPRGWYETHYVLRDGSKVKAMAFTGKDCNGRFRREKQMTVPVNDKLQNVYLTLF